MQLIPVLPNQILDVWPHIRGLAERVLRYSDMTEEQLLKALQEGGLFLVVGRRKKRCAGFFVFKIEGRNLHIVMMNSLTGAALMPEFIDFTHKQGIESLTFTSPRRGWHRRAPQPPCSRISRRSTRVCAFDSRPTAVP